MILTAPQERTRFLRFAIVGAVGAVIDFAVFNIFVQFTPIKAVFASMISFAVAVCSNFFWNRVWTYPDLRSKPVARQMGQFVLINLVGLGIRTPLFAWLEHVLIKALNPILPLGTFLTPTFLGHNIALAIAILVVMLWNFFANRFWTYNDVN